MARIAHRYDLSGRDCLRGGVLGQPPLTTLPIPECNLKGTSGAHLRAGAMRPGPAASLDAAGPRAALPGPCEVMFLPG